MPIKFNLKALLKKYNVTQKDLSINTGIRLATISDICNNKIKQLPISALDSICDYLMCTPGELIEYNPPNMINMSKISINTYNKLLLSKPFVGGIYKIKTSVNPIFTQYFETEYILCVVTSNSISIPLVDTSMIIPLSSKSTGYPLETPVDVLGNQYLAHTEFSSNINNKYITHLCSLVSLTECIELRLNLCKHLGLPIESKSDISVELELYFEHLKGHKDSLFLNTPIYNLL